MIHLFFGQWASIQKLDSIFFFQFSEFYFSSTEKPHQYRVKLINIVWNRNTSVVLNSALWMIKQTKLYLLTLQRLKRFVNLFVSMVNVDSLESDWNSSTNATGTIHKAQENQIGSKKKYLNFECIFGKRERIKNSTACSLVSIFVSKIFPILMPHTMFLRSLPFVW